MVLTTPDKMAWLTPDELRSMAVTMLAHPDWHPTPADDKDQAKPTPAVTPSTLLSARPAPSPATNQPTTTSTRSNLPNAPAPGAIGTVNQRFVCCGPIQPPSNLFAPEPAQPKITDRVGQPSISSTQGPVAPVAQRVVLYEEDPTDTQGKRYLGSVIWRTEMVSPAGAQSPEVAVRADLEIPERRITIAMSIRRNTDQALPASHTVEIVFNLPADFPFGGISNVPGILMKQAEQTRGAPLAGLAVKVTSGFFLVGLSAVDSEMQRNLDLLRERSWVDIPIVYNNARRAVLAIEKGTPGERAFAEAFAAWRDKDVPANYVLLKVRPSVAWPAAPQPPVAPPSPAPAAADNPDNPANAVVARAWEALMPAGTRPVRTVATESAPRTIRPAALAAPLAGTWPNPSMQVVLPPAPASGYLVQLFSGTSEVEAQDPFRMLEDKSSVLRGRQPIIPPADLGDKRVLFSGDKAVLNHTMVGPFATKERANQFCDNLKAAGGKCIVQRNWGL
jgi:hypothetical protein